MLPFAIAVDYFFSASKAHVTIKCWKSDSLHTL